MISVLNLATTLVYVWGTCESYRVTIEKNTTHENTHYWNFFGEVKKLNLRVHKEFISLFS